MNDGDVFMLSPLSARGEQKLQRLRASIRQCFGTGAEVVRAAPSGRAPSPRSRLRQRLARASRLTSDEIFFQEFGSGDDLRGLDFDLVRADAAAAAAAPPLPGSGALGTLGASGTFQSALPARSSAASQPVRPARVRTPKKVALKRSRVGESSAERAKPLQKPRLRGSSPSARGLAFPTAEPLLLQREPAQIGGGVKAASAAFSARASPSKLLFPSVSARALFAQRQAPLR